MGVGERATDHARSGHDAVRRFDLGGDLLMPRPSLAARRNRQAADCQHSKHRPTADGQGPRRSWRPIFGQRFHAPPWRKFVAHGLIVACQGKSCVASRAVDARRPAITPVGRAPANLVIVGRRYAFSSPSREPFERSGVLKRSPCGPPQKKPQQQGSGHARDLLYVPGRRPRRNGFPG